MFRFRTRHRLVQRDRRGATTVFVAFLGVALLGFAALAIDVGRFYAGANELQTVSDAAALRGALLMQSSPGANPTDSIIAYALRNPAMKGTATLVGSDIKPAKWIDSTLFTLDTSGAVTWENANAVQVTARKTAGFIFGRVLRSVAPTPARRSGAWIANQTGFDCIQPMGIPASVISAKLGQSIMTQAGILALRDTLLSTNGSEKMTIIMGPSVSGGYSPGTNAPRDGDFVAITEGHAHSPNGFEDMVHGTECGDQTVDWSTGAVIDAHPGKGNSIAKDVDNFYDGSGPCKSPASNSPVCRDPITSNAGISITLAVVVPSGNSATVQMLMRFRLACVYMGESFKKGDPNEHCLFLQSSYFTSRSIPDNSYPSMTIVGYPELPSFAALGPGTSLGNIPSTSQRLILVR